MNHDELAASMAADMEAIGRTNMPFGKFGPQHFPPDGVPIYDLPAEYLGWFAMKGFPKGRFGELLQIVHQMKADGSDEAFNSLRRRKGGKTKLREERPREWKVSAGYKKPPR